MNILLLADEPSKSLWDFYDETKLKGVDLILSAGDLPPAYLSFLVTFSNCPLLYVHGNHDDIYDMKPPEGCICIDDQIYVYEGIRILGLGGSMRYNEGDSQYTESQMKRRIRRLVPRLYRNKRKYGRYVDILITHAPPFGMGDGPDLCHTGFKCFLDFMDRFQPKYLLHGHVHLFDSNAGRITQYGNTKVVNIFGSYMVEDDTLEGLNAK